MIEAKEYEEMVETLLLPPGSSIELLTVILKEYSGAKLGNLETSAKLVKIIREKFSLRRNESIYLKEIGSRDTYRVFKVVELAGKLARGQIEDISFEEADLKECLWFLCNHRILSNFGLSELASLDIIMNHFSYLKEEIKICQPDLIKLIGEKKF